MSDYMKTISALKDAEERLKKRFESRVEMTNVVNVVHNTLSDMGQRVADINSGDRYFQNEYNNPHKQSHREGKTSASPEAVQKKQMIAEDVSDLLNQIDVLIQIICPMSELLKDYQRSAERISDRYPLTQDTLE